VSRPQWFMSHHQMMHGDFNQYARQLSTHGGVTRKDTVAKVSVRLRGSAGQVQAPPPRA